MLFRSAFGAAKAAAINAKYQALAIATTEEQRIAAKNAFKAAIASAKATRDQALASLGERPIKPSKPS